MGSLTALALILFAAADAPRIADAVPSESGFEGAVQVVEAAADGEFEYVTVNIPYRDVRGQAKTGQGRLVVRRADLESGKPLPAFCHVHYEKNVGGAKDWCRRGWAVATSHYGDPAQGGYALELAPGDSYNLSVALIQWVRRLPVIDRSRLHIDGGSAGGYMALAMGAHHFPVTAVTADSPVANWPYNLNYLEANKPASGYGKLDLKASPTPYLTAVTMLSDWAYGVFGKDLASDSYYDLSPISYLDRITCPTLVLTATGDMLVPPEQYTAEHVYAVEAALFPEGYVRDFEKLAPTDKSRRRLVDLLGDKIETFLVERPAEVPELTLAMARGEEKEPKTPKNIDRPWSKTKQWSLVMLDEGPALPHSPHSRYKWGQSPDGFVEAHRKQAPAPELLTAAKLDWLLQRYEGNLAPVPKLADGTPCNRLNFDGLEKRDVAAGLLDYAAMGPEHEARLKSLYAEAARKPFGDTLDLEQLRRLAAGRG